MNIPQDLILKYIRTKFRLLAAVSKQKAAKEAFQLFCTPFMRPSARFLPAYHDSEQLSLELNNEVMRGYRWKGGNSGTIMLIHGFASVASKFQHYIEPLLKHGYDVVAFDAPAHGASAGKTVNAIQYSELLSKMIEQYGPVKGFLAHSFGGLAVCLALEKIDHSTDTKLVLIAPATETTSAIDDAFKLIQIRDEKVRKEFDNIIFQLSGKQPEWFSIRRAISNIRAQVLWIHDENDLVTPFKDAKKVMDDKPPHVQFLITSGLGHSRIYKDKKVVNTVVSFLEKAK